jgi:hypothetical protein
VVTVTDAPRRAEVEICWQGGAHTQLTVPLVHRGVESTRTPEDTVDLIRRLAAHSSGRQIAAILNKQGRRTGTRLPFTDPPVKFLRQKHGIRAAPPPDPDGDLFAIERPASEPASPPPRSTGGSEPGCSRASRPPPTRRGGSG